MNIFFKGRIFWNIISWRLTWNRRNTRYCFTLPGNPKFMGPRDAVKLIKDGAVLCTSGLGGNQRACIMYWAIREMFEETGRPAGLTVISIGGQGGRGIAPGTVEELGLPGLTTRFIAGHLETFKAQLRIGDAGKCELQCVPQGVLALLLDAQARGEDSLLMKTGVGTFFDPRAGRGSPLIDPAAEQFITAEGDMLRYRIPKIDVSVFNAPAADREGNIYVKNAAMIGESYEMSLAAKRNGGIVIANVGLIVDKGYDEIFLPADMVDAVVYYPRTEQSGSRYHYKPWPWFTTSSDKPLEDGLEALRFINNILKITPVRTDVDNALARLAASVFAENARKGLYVNIGVGLPEEVCRLIYEGGLLDDITLLTESGVIGGVPAPGVFFGAATNPKRIITSPRMFKLCYEKLDVTVLGLLQADSEGSVNVSKRGGGAVNYVGPGGFIDLTTAAKMVVFVGTWMAHSKMSIDGGGLTFLKKGTPKFVDKVDEITFCGPEAVKAGKKVFYVTNVGVFGLTKRGMELIRVMPGVDIQKDIVEASPMKIVLPESGVVPVVPDDVVTGKGFKLTLSK
jgi:propionate CoA-transferase